MRKPYSISLQVGGARDETAKTSWKKKRNNISIVDQTKFGNTSLGEGIITQDTTAGAKTIELASDGAYNSFNQRNMSVN